MSLLGSVPEQNEAGAATNVNESGEVVYLVEDDASVREALTDLLAAAEMKVIAFESAADFLNHQRTDIAGCLVLDLQLPEMSGLELQERLGPEAALPIVFVTGRADIPSTVRAMKAGAIEFLTKPVDRNALLTAVRLALARDRESRERRAEISELKRRVSSLSPREREVLPLIVAGLLNKQSAAKLGVTEITVQVHRGHIMRKMEASTFADLVRMCSALGIPAALQVGSKHPHGPESTSPSRGNDDCLE
jgi:FixJ family two-component response regulator